MMKRILAFATAAALLLALLGCGGALPALTITQTFHDAVQALEQGQRVMVIELDGLGWEMLQRADAPYIQSMQPQKAQACYLPISPVGLASMLTGELPAVHGVRDRETRELTCEDIFAKAQAMGKTCAYVEGSHALLRTSLTPVMSLNDAEVFSNAHKNLAADLLFVHFHEIDETAHAHGPYAEETLQKISEIDGYVQALCEEFGGRVIVTADHGLHETRDGGDHGQRRPEDMEVPYVYK